MSSFVDGLFPLLKRLERPLLYDVLIRRARMCRLDDANEKILVARQFAAKINALKEDLERVDAPSP